MCQWIGLTLLCGVLFTVATASFTLLYNNITVQTNPEYLTMNTSIAKNQKSFSISVNVLKPYTNFYMDVKMHTALVHKGEPKMKELFSRSTDFCKYVKQKPVEEVLLNILYEEFIRKSNGFMVKCPVAAGQYAVVGYEVNLAQMPPYLPNALFSYQMTIFFKGATENTMISDITFNGLVDNEISWKRVKSRKN